MYGIWNDWKKEFQFGIREPTKAKASKKLFKRIGKDAYKWRFEIREIKNTSKNVKGVKTMKKFDGYEKAEAFTGEYEKMETGGYVCKILQVKAEDKDYGTLLRIGFDILEGDKAGFYKRQFDKKKATKPDAKWPGMYYQTIKEDDLRYFKGFMTAIEESNPGYKWDWDEQKLKNKMFGGVFGEEEYEIQQGKREGEIGVSVKCMWVRSVDAIREGKYTVPEIKRLNGNNGAGTRGQHNNGTLPDGNFFAMTDDDELPF